MGVSLTFQLDLKSDYHVGAGHGLASLVDSALLRDDDGVPVLRGTMLAGLFRDGLYRLLQTPPMRKFRKCEASGLPHGEAPAHCGSEGASTGGAALCPICRLLGSPALPKRWSVHSARPADWRIPGVANRALSGLGAQPVWRCRVDPRFRRVQTHKVFSQEEGDQHWKFQFCITHEDSGEGLLEEAALWTAAARMIREFGRSRRRGLGECLLRLIDARAGDDFESGSPASKAPNGNTGSTDSPAPERGDPDALSQEKLLDLFETVWVNGDGLPAPEGRYGIAGFPEPAGTAAPIARSEEVNEAAASHPSKEAVFCRVILRLDEPVLITERSAASNQYHARTVISGSTLRGALAWRARDRRTCTYDRFLDLFLRGGVRFSALYPAEYGNRFLYPAVPAPLDLLTCKVHPWGGTSPGHGFQKTTLDSEPAGKCARCEAPLMAVRDFVCLDRRRGCTLEPQQRSELHIRVDPDRQRVSEGDLYGYSVLGTGQYYVGMLRFESRETLEQFREAACVQENAPASIRLGKALRRGHGQCSLWMEEAVASPWCPMALEERVPDPALPVHLLLLSDTIIRDPWGRYPNGFLKSWLAEELRLGPVEILGSAASTTWVDSFNGTTGLPRWRDQAVVGGSAAGLRLLNPPGDALARMHALESEGIGLRRTEGYGRIVFNHFLYATEGPQPSVSIPLKSAMLPGGIGSKDPRIAAALFENRWPERVGEVLKGKDLEHGEFEGLARWMTRNRFLSPDLFKACLRETWGTIDAELKAALGGEREVGARKKKRFLDEKGKEGRAAILKLLEELEKESPAHRARGIFFIAERLVESSREGASQ